MTTIGKPKVELIGRDGNAFAILGECQRAARKAGWSSEAILRFQAEAMEGDYDELLTTVLRHFDVEGGEEEPFEDGLVWDDDYGDYV